MAQPARVTAQPLDSPIVAAPGVVHREREYFFGAAGNRGANGFILPSHDGSTPLGHAKGNQSIYSLPTPRPIPTGAGTPFKNLRSR